MQKEGQNSHYPMTIDKPIYCPNCQIELKRKLTIDSPNQYLIQTSCQRCNYLFYIDTRNMRVIKPLWPKNQKEEEYITEVKGVGIKKKLYDWPNVNDNVDMNKLLISFYGRSNIRSPLLISDSDGKPYLVPNEKTMCQADKIMAQIDIFKKPMKKIINVGEATIFRKSGPGTIYRTNLRILYIRPVQLSYHLDPSILPPTNPLHWKNNGYHESFSLPLSKITKVMTSTGKRGIFIHLEEIMEPKIYEVTLSPYKRLHNIVDDLLVE